MHLETEMLTRKTTENALEMWDSFKNSLRDATQFFIPSKKLRNTVNHSGALC